MKRIFTILIIWAVLISGSFADSEEHISELIQKLNSLSDEEFPKFYGGLSEETKDAIAEVQRERSRLIQKQSEAFNQKMRELQLPGLDNFVNTLMFPYSRLGGKYADSLDDPENREEEKKRIVANTQRVGTLLYEAPAPLLVGLWEKYEERIRQILHDTSRERPTKDEVMTIEKHLLDRLEVDLKKIIAAESEQDRPWPQREKWRHLFDFDEKGSKISPLTEQNTVE